ncbi:peptidoglycan bridge formation glycyltransferase FemA/FemB family protein, partial [Staphylococcus hominis]|uniref:peptidoglycan bridge formation glycyltransferase FemA/FemB family protein n=1 Tax=Staphylococcus hominis TaxID=1290 RepID=UPI0011A8BFA3
QCLYLKLHPYSIYQIYHKHINSLQRHQKNHPLLNLFKSHRYQHHPFTTKYHPSTQLTCIPLNYLKPQTPPSFKNHFHTQPKTNINKPINYPLKVTFLKTHQLNIF